MARREREILEHAVHTIAEQAVKADELVDEAKAGGGGDHPVTVHAKMLRLRGGPDAPSGAGRDAARGQSLTECPCCLQRSCLQSVGSLLRRSNRRFSHHTAPRMASTNTQREMVDTTTTVGGRSLQSLQYFHVSPMKQSSCASVAAPPAPPKISQVRNRTLIAKMTMSIELQLTTGDEEWTFNMTESIVPGPGDALNIEDPDGHVRDFRVAGRRITLVQGEPVGSVLVGIDLEPA